MVRQHGNMIISTLFGMKTVNLLEPESKLHQVIALHVSRNQNVRIINPILGGVEPVRAVIHDIL